MKMLRCLPTLFVLLLLGVAASGQNKTITGKITNNLGEVMPGVTVTAPGKKVVNTTSKEDGSYTIAAGDAKTLLVSYVGYVSQTIDIGDKNVIDIVLQPNASAMDEVVIIGYGTQKKSHLTGSVSKFRNEKLDETPVSRLDQALQGKIAGVQIQNISSEAGSDPKVRVRGTSSINAGTNPLVVVDGHPVPDGLSFVNMSDVESVEVLKDAASAAIYGSRGASGVIIITTKSGKADKPKYSVKFSTGAKTAYETYPMMTTTEYTNMLYYEASLKAKDPSITPPSPTQIIANNERAAYIIEQTLLGGEGADWQAEALRNATVRNLMVNVSGGKKDIRYFISGGYQRDQGLMYHSEYDRFNLRTKLDANLGKRVKMTFNLNPSYIKRERPSTNFIDFVRFQSFLPVYHTDATAAFVNQSATWAHIRPGDFAQARHFNGRSYSGTMPDGSIWTSSSTVDPFNTANNTPKSVMETRSITSNDYRVLSSADFTVNILPGFDFKTMASFYVNYTVGLDFAKRSSNREGDINKGVYNNRLFTDVLSENLLTYNKKIKDHSFNLLAGYTVQQTKIDDQQITGLDYPSDNITTLNTALQIDQNKTATFNLRNQIGLQSWLGRLTYAYQNKYLLSASYRTDGSSYFAPGKKWGSFPSVSLGWVLTEEKFMDKADWISNLKLRGSYGVTGNNRIVDFAFVDLLYAANYPLGAQTGNSVVGQVPSRDILSNPDITWERTFQFNGGVDISVFNNVVNLSVDVYQSKTDQLLLKQATMGFTGVPQYWNNIGRLRNRGIEFELTTNNIRKKDLRWTTSANFSHNRNKILNLADEKYLTNLGERSEIYRNVVGGPLIQYFGYKTDGVWLSQAQIDEAVANGLTTSLSNMFVPGGLKLVDVNGDNRIDEDDRTYTGNPYPDFTWGIVNNITYKAFDLSFMFQGSQGGQLVNGDPNYNETKRYNKNYNQNRWLSPMFPGDGKTPYSTIGFNWMLTDYVVEDASYWALREVIIGYTLPAKFVKRTFLNSARLYFSGQNLFFHTPKSYRGINTEARFNSGPYSSPLLDGYQRGSYPMPRTILFGIDVNF